MLMFTIFRAVMVRLLFAVHGLLSIWRLYMVVQETWCLYLLVALGGILLEAIITIYKKRGKEWKWFCPSVFFYLASVVPAIWFLELHEMESRIALKENINATLWRENETAEDLSIAIDQLGLEINIPLALSSDLWLRVIEQFLLLMLILGRWILPKGALSHDQLSQLLLVYVGTAADIVEFYEAFSEDGVKYNRVLCYIVLGIWTLSLLQFTLVLTATKARRDQSGVPSPHEADDNIGCCKPEIYGILISIILQDLPFLVVRLLLIFRHKIVSYTNMFFTSKNSLVILLLVYRLCVVQLEAKSTSKAKQNPRVRDARDCEAAKVNLIGRGNPKMTNARPRNNYTASRPQQRTAASRM
ncbi:transmembrane protein 26-like [Gigantopelta aegis]|uniref:transmembrane protein 26-like n=1 Tax=Gigantopelta aegis TaxID=1735272 RepID=UPI001B888820|nr:transmembrane protein 26-like [Gigantopelta aegis]